MLGGCISNANVMGQNIPPKKYYLQHLPDKI